MATKTNGANERDELGLTNMDKANITRFSTDLAESEGCKGIKHLSKGRIRTAIMADKHVREMIAKYKTLVWTKPEFQNSVDILLAAIPVTAQRRPAMTEEERAKFNKKRREAILETAGDGPVNEHSLHALRVHYLQGLKAEERNRAATKFDKAAVQLEA